MADAHTNNYGLVLPEVGGDVGTWGGIVNATLTTYLDGILGNTKSYVVSSADQNISLSDWQNNGTFVVTGNLTKNISLILPQAPNNAAVSPGGRFTVVNATTGNFAVYVKTVWAPGAAALVPQNFRSLLWSDGGGVYPAGDGVYALGYPYAGNPNGVINYPTPSAASGSASLLLLDTVDQALFAALGNGTPGVDGTQWLKIGPQLPVPGGYLTLTPSNPISSGSGVTIYYTAYQGNAVPVYNGTGFVPLVLGSDLPMSMTGMAVNTAYDIFAFSDNLSLQMGWGPPWSGLNARSVGLQRINGILVNSALMSLTNVALGGSFSIATSQATYLGSVYTDASAATVTINRSLVSGGLPARCGLWNAYNRTQIGLQLTDPANFSQGTPGVWQSYNNNNNNSVITFCGLAEDSAYIDYDVYGQGAGPNASPSMEASLALNETTGFTPATLVGTLGATPSANAITIAGTLHAKMIMPPSLGVNTFTAINQCLQAGCNWFGNVAHMLLMASYRG